MKFLKIIISLFILSLLISCATSFNIETDKDAIYDLSKYSTFKIENPSKEEGISQISLNPILFQRIERSVRFNLKNKGFKEVKDQPDMVVRYYLATDREVDRSQSFSSFNRRGFYNDSDQKYYKVDNDSFSIRFHDSKTDDVIWYAFSRFNRSSSPNDQSEVNLLIDKVLSNFRN